VSAGAGDDELYAMSAALHRACIDVLEAPLPDISRLRFRISARELERAIKGLPPAAPKPSRILKPGSLIARPKPQPLPPGL
jgi:hypothetical protein